MKKLSLVSICWMMLLACNKNLTTDFKDYPKLKEYVSARANSDLQQRIDWSSIQQSEGADKFHRVGFKNEDFSKHFIVIKEDSTGAITGAKEIKLSFDTESMNGNLYSRNLDQLEFSIYPVTNGALAEVTGLLADEYADPTGPPMLAKIIPDPRYYSTNGMTEYSALYYINIRQAYDALGGSTSTYLLTGGEKKNAYGGIDNYTSSVSGHPVNLIIDNGLSYEKNTVVDIDKMISCFNAVPDQGAVCSISILTDLPVNEYPGYLVNYKQQYAGHCFLQLKKSNQGKSVTQNIGFYPKTSIKSMATTTPITGRFVNDELHGYNASFQMNIDFSQFSEVLQAIKDCQTKGIKYDIDNYNCTDFALNIFNVVRGNDQFLPQKYQLPEAPYNPLGTNLPHGVFRELVLRKKSKPGDRPGIKISTINSYSDLSTATCQ